jgi:hypothetical protein
MTLSAGLDMSVTMNQAPGGAGEQPAAQDASAVPQIRAPSKAGQIRHYQIWVLRKWADWIEVLPICFPIELAEALINC